MVDNAAALPPVGPAPGSAPAPARLAPGGSRPRYGSRASRRRFRILPWRGEVDRVLLSPARGLRHPTSAEVSRVMEELAAQGVRRVVTPALNDYEAEVFYQAGFQHLESLHLLLYQLHDFRVGAGPLSAAAKGTVPVKSARRWHTASLLEVDNAAFEGFWRFDAAAIDEAKRATPSQWTRRALIAGQPVGYAVTGRAGQKGYLQRLAVDPTHQGRGIGTTLIGDAFSWLIRKGATSCLVNTQITNTRALGLYEYLGFERQPRGLSVLSWDRMP